MSLIQFSRETRVVPSTATFVTESDGNVVLLDMRRGWYFGLNDVGSRVWSLIASDTALGAIVDVIVREFEVDEDTADADVRALMQEMASAGLVETRV